MVVLGGGCLLMSEGVGYPCIWALRTPTEAGACSFKRLFTHRGYSNIRSHTARGVVLGIGGGLLQAPTAWRTIFEQPL